MCAEKIVIVRLIHSGICAFFGYSAFIAFIILGNYPSAVLGLVSGNSFVCFKLSKITF